MDLHARVSTVDALESMRGYDRSDLELHLAAIDAECDRLRSAIASMEARRDELAAAQPASATEQLGAIMVEAQAELTEEWDACRRFGAALEDAMEALASRIVAEGRARADSLRAIVAEVRAARAGAAGDEGERWWNDVIDLTQAGQPERAPIA